MAPVAIADDANVAITVVAKKLDTSGDPGYVLNIQNRTDRKIYVYSAEGWTVDGATVDDAVLLEEVDAGQTVEGFMWFDHESGGLTTLDSLKSVVGKIVVEDYATSAQLGVYAFQA